MMAALLKSHINDIVAITEEEFEEISTYFKKECFKKHQYLMQTGKPAPYEFFVLKGLLKSTHADQLGETHIMQFAMEEWWISDMQAFTTGGPADVDNDCLEDTEVLAISSTDKEKLCAASKKMEYFFRQKSIAGNIALQRRVLMLMCANATERYENLIRQYPALYERVSKKLIAAYLGVTRETLSRLTTVQCSPRDAEANS